MKKLLDYLIHLPPSKVVFSDISGNSTVKSLTAEFIAFSSIINKIQNKHIALNLSNNAQLARCLLFLDGFANSILILPPDLNHEERLRFLALANSEIIIVENNADEFPIESIQVKVYIESGENKNTFEYATTNTDWIIATSGTTGTPKLVRHSLKSLSNTTLKQTANSEFSWGLLYGLHRFAGIQVYLQAIMSGSVLVITESKQCLDKQLELLKKHKVNCLSGTPTLWRKLLMHNAGASLLLRSITLGGETSDESILQALHSRFPKAKLRHIYASTEAGVGFSVNDGKAGFPLYYLNDKNAQVLLKLSENNTLLIKSNSAAKAYVGPDAIQTQDDYIDTGDLVRIDGERCFFNGRLNAAINVGGNKVQAEQVEAVLMAHRSVALAKVFAKKNPITGNVVQADVIINESANNINELRDNLRTHCAEKLPRYMVPALIRIVDDIALTPAGKIERNN